MEGTVGGLARSACATRPEGRPWLRWAVLAAVAGALVWTASASADTVRLKLVRTIETSDFVPPSPDPSGIIYRQGGDRLLIADSEVNETSLYRNSNLFTATRAGLGVGSGTTLSFANEEPSDLGSDPRNGTLYVSDDDRDRISRVRAGTRPGPRHGRRRHLHL
jgi:DNA-binding beta-propeller fold protein YncE